MHDRTGPKRRTIGALGIIIGSRHRDLRQQSADGVVDVIVGRLFVLPGRHQRRILLERQPQSRFFVMRHNGGGCGVVLQRLGWSADRLLKGRAADRELPFGGGQIGLRARQPRFRLRHIGAGERTRLEFQRGRVALLA